MGREIVVFLGIQFSAACITADVKSSVEVFTGPIFNPNSSPPHETGSKSIPPQIKT